jgi:hypothetical protein
MTSTPSSEQQELCCYPLSAGGSQNWVDFDWTAKSHQWDAVNMQQASSQALSAHKTLARNDQTIPAIVKTVEQARLFLECCQYH